MGTLARKDRKASSVKLELKVIKACRASLVQLVRRDLKAILQDPRAQRVLPETPVLKARKELLALKVIRQVQPVQLDPLEQQDNQDLPAPKVHKDNKENLEFRVHLVFLVRPDPRARLGLKDLKVTRLVRQVQPVRKEVRVLKEVQVKPDPKALLATLAVPPAQLEKPDLPVKLVQRDHKVR